ncbi:hypothetical protein B0H12DRAFT_667586 [Mycena haematopus]|nr:hypothetical protein B0H12DRAFT_667586 [Mycena haematopus]
MNSDKAPALCRICKQGGNDIKNVLLTCHQCNRSWHHRCHQPPIKDGVVFELWTHFLAAKSLNAPMWTCTKCSRKATTLPTAQPSPTRYIPETGQNTTTSAPVVIDITESPEAPRLQRVQPSRALVAEIVDVDFPPPVSLTPSPSARPARAESSRAQVADIIDFEAELPRPADTNVFIEVLDSPPSVGLNLPVAPAVDLPLPSPAVNSPIAVVELAPTEVEDSGIRTSSGDSQSISPSFSDLFLPDTPTVTVTRLPSMDVDIKKDAVDQKLIWNVDAEETEQKPLSLLFQNLTVANRPRGGTLGPAWMRYETSDETAKWDRIIEKQKIPKPLSGRKPAKTRFGGGVRESFVVLPFDGNNS